MGGVTFESHFEFINQWGGGGGYIHSIYGCHSPPEDTQYFLCLMLNLDNTEATFHAVIIQNDYSFPKVRLHTYHS